MEKDYTNAVISGEQLRNDLAETSKRLGGEKILGRYSKALFADELDEDHEHYNLREIDADEEYSLTSTTLNEDFWYRFLGIKNYTSTVYDGIKAITEVLREDMTGTAAEIADRLYVDENDVADLSAYMERAESEGETVYLFRFSQTDYYSVYIHDNTKEVEQTGMKTMFGSKERGYAAQQTVFLGFDIISLTFERNGEYYVIPVVSDPIDIIGDITPPVEDPPNGCGNVKRIAAILIGTLLAALLVFVIVKAVRAATKNKNAQKPESNQRPKQKDNKRDKSVKTKKPKRDKGKDKTANVKTDKPKRKDASPEYFDDEMFLDDYLDFPDGFWENIE